MAYPLNCYDNQYPTAVTLTNNLQFSFQPISDIREVEKKWALLEKHCNNSNVFLSWGWIGTWLKTFRPDAQLMEVRQGADLIAIAVLVQSKEKRHHFLSSQVFRLHQTGDREKDQIWTEYNGILTASSNSHAVHSCLLQNLRESPYRWDELIIGAATDKTISQIEQRGYYRADVWRSESFGVDLQSLRTSGKTYLESLSRNTRQQINRCQRRYQESGDVELQEAATLVEAHSWFDQLGSFHKKRWGNKESGFSNPHFVQFHRALIEELWPNGKIELVRLIVGQHVKGYLYNFICGDRVFFYMSGLEAEQDNKLKPGLLSHALCIQKHLDEGRNYYDFMGGSDRYKKNLGSSHCEMFVTHFQRKRPKLVLENLLRSIKRNFVKGR